MLSDFQQFIYVLMMFEDRPCIRYDNNCSCEKINGGVKRVKKIKIVGFTIVLVILGACSSQAKTELDTIVFADAKWDSIQVHNHIAQTIVEEGYGYDTEVTSGSTAATMQGLRSGDINVFMEVWIKTIEEIYEEAIETGDIKTVSVNFDDNMQGLYVPTYVIEGDEERGIEPIAPDLKTVEDLKQYGHLFEDPEDPDKGRIINAPSGWAVDDIITDKIELYDLDETMNNFMPGSDAAIVTSLVSAYEKGEPWVGYYWTPTWVTAKYDLTLLEEPEFDEEIWDETRGTEFPPDDVHVAVHKDLPTQAEDVVEFLSNYETNSDLTAASLNYMHENDVSTEDAALWWLEEYEDVWMEWVPGDIAEKVQNAI